MAMEDLHKSGLEDDKDNIETAEEFVSERNSAKTTADTMRTTETVNNDEKEIVAEEEDKIQVDEVEDLQQSLP